MYFLYKKISDFASIYTYNDDRFILTMLTMD